MFIKRHLDLGRLLQKKSFFLFGPRASGKSTLIAQQLADQAVVIDLLRADVWSRASENPVGFMAMALARKKKWVVIDEIQRLPELLNEVHRLIETRASRFLLTGSSMNKLRRGGVNLLAGRAWLAHLFPLTSNEIDNFDLDHYLHYGGLPAVHTSSEPDEELSAYLTVYLQEEIKSEGLIRKLPPFTRFLRTIGMVNTEIINFSKIANDCQVPTTTIIEYVRILEETLTGAVLEVWNKSKKRKAVRTGKFYLFDTGVARTLAEIEHIERNSNLYGKAFEHFIWLELRAYLSYSRTKMSLTYWRSRQGHEVDFITGDHVAIEVKASKRTSQRDLKGLQALDEEGIIKDFYLISCDPINNKYGKVSALFWQDFLDQLWQGEII